jgi:hypothetical protein
MRGALLFSGRNGYTGTGVSCHTYATGIRWAEALLGSFGKPKLHFWNNVETDES